MKQYKILLNVISIYNSTCYKTYTDSKNDIFCYIDYKKNIKKSFNSLKKKE